MVTNDTAMVFFSPSRRYFGHRRTIRPNAKKLYSVFLNRENMTWEAFASKVRTNQIGFMGEPNEVRPGRGEFHENPSTCICENPKAKAFDSGVLEAGTKSGTGDTGKGISESTDHLTDEQDSSELDYGELEEKVLSNKTGSEYDLFIKSEDPELEEILSD